MIKKRRRKSKSNQGNSFVVVVATVSFLAVLVTALLVAVALCYRLKAYDINTRDNFYYLEQAMDEIYEGVGSVSMKHLNDAFDETAEVLVYYDTIQKTYVTMDNDNANKLMKATFLSKVKKDARFANSTSVKNALEALITNRYRPASDPNPNPEGVQLSVGNPTWSPNGEVLTLQDIVLKRTAKYSTSAARALSNQENATDFIQSITTDLVISMPNLNIDFSLTDQNSNLYDFVLISDMGVEIYGGTTRSTIVGNVYAAADFYNKEYESDGTADATDLTKPMSNRVNSYSTDDLKSCNGVNEQSMYSGFYVSGAKVSVVADKLIVPGSIASMNCANVEILGNSDETGVTASQVWTDGIILGGYSAKKSAGSDDLRGASMVMKADAFVYDDLELNAAASSYALEGNYYGYNYASVDNREYSQEFIDAATNRKFLSDVEINDGNIILEDDGTGTDTPLVGQAHYNSSSVVVNGNDSTLDLSSTDSMYIAGQAYVELSKKTTKKSFVARRDGDDIIGLDEVDDTNQASTDKVDRETYNYQYDEAENYTEIDNKKMRIQDYHTGEGLSIKSNQLAYIPPYRLVEKKTKADGTVELYAKWPTEWLEDHPFFGEMWEDLNKVPVIKTTRKEVRDGNSESVDYYFYDFSKVAKDEATMNRYMEEYAALFQTPNGEVHSIGELATFYDITAWDEFKVNDFDVNYDNIYSNSAISVVQGGKVNIVANSDSATALTNANESLRTGTSYDLLKSKMDGETQATINANGSPSTDSGKAKYAKDMTTGLQKRYREMKMLLTDRSNATATAAAAVSYAYDAKDSTLTPINYYFNFSKLDGINGVDKLGEETAYDHNNGVRIVDKLQSKYEVYLSDGDVTVSSNGGRVKGIVLCKGDVTFDSSVKEFEGLIVAGGKIKVENSVNFVSNAEIIKSVLRECDESKYLNGHVDHSDICDLFRHYTKTAEPDTTTDQNYEALKSVTAVQYEDILSFENWKKNVD